MGYISWCPPSPPAGDGSTWTELYTHGNTHHNRNQFELQPGYQVGPAPPRHWLYYGNAEPIGAVMRNLRRPDGAPRQVGVVGLGAGSLACYRQPGEQWTFFEIDRLVVQWAQQHMSTLAHCTTERPQFRLGDARQVLQRHNPETAGHFDLLVLDAFSSDAIPTHLLTREALALYRARLTPAGVMAFHISNRYLCLDRVLAQTAASLGLYSRGQVGPTSQWLIVTATAAQGIALLPQSQAPPQLGPVWTDSYRPLLPAFCAWQQLRGAS